MAGGTWIAQNKVRPGAYINFKAVPAPSSNLGSRGIMTMPVAMNWGPQNEVIELLSTDLQDGNCLKKIGYLASDAESLVYRQALANAYKGPIFRLDVGGTKATATNDTLTAVAKYPGSLGNRIAFVVSENATFEDMWDVITVFKEYEVDRQTVAKTATPADLKDNDYIVWTGSGALTATETAGVYLVGGTDGTVSSEAYSSPTGYLKAIKGLTWNTMAIPQDDSIANDSVKTLVKEFIEELREKQGKKVQAVLLDKASNYEGIISVKQGYATLTEEIPPALFVAFVAGLTAGAEVNESNTYKVIEDAVRIIYPESVAPYDNEEIIKLLNQGQFILSTRQDGAIIVEKDINTLHAPYPSKDVNYAFSKNRVIRTLDEINNAIKQLFENTYLGKVDNEDDGRNLFKADVISYLNLLQSIKCIQNFDSTTDIEVLPGNDIDAVVCNLWVQPVDSMEKLYMTVNVS